MEGRPIPPQAHDGEQPGDAAKPTQPIPPPGEAPAEDQTPARDGWRPADAAKHPRPIPPPRQAPPRNQEQPQGELLAVVAPMVIQVVAMSLVTAAVPALRDGSPVDVSVGAVTSLGLTTLAMAALAVFAKLVLTKALSRPGLWIIIALVGLAVCIAPAPIWRQPAPPLPAAPMLIIGLLIMAAGAVWIARQANRDPVVLPQGKALTDSRRPSLILALLVPGATIVLAAFIWLVG